MGVGIVNNRLLRTAGEFLLLCARKWLVVETVRG